MSIARSQCDVVAGAELEGIGRARRFACEGTAEELWRLPAADERVAARLLDLGRACLGGFERGGVDDDGVWLVRRPASPRLDAAGTGEPRPWREALAVVRDVAGALAACERAALAPGPLRLADIVSCDGRAWLAADPLVRAMLGAPPEAQGTRSAPSPRWTPPEQAAGAPWDAAANRYVLGLVAYRLLAGVHPFRGAGLRHALAAQATEPAPPFDDAIARALRPGVQSFVLHLIDPDPRARPADAAAIAARCAELLADRDAAAHPSPRAARSRERASSPAAERPGTTRDHAGTSRARPRSRRGAPFSWRVAAPIAAGLALAAAALAAARPVETVRPVVKAAAPITSMTASTCAPCHAREVAEWQRSVMAHAAKSPLYGALESVVEEQVGRDARCPSGAGILRKAGGDVCRDAASGVSITGAGGEHWCVNCHAPGENLSPRMPAWSTFGSAETRRPMRDLLPAASMEGISCAACHATIGPVGPHTAARTFTYEGNATWTSLATGATFGARPEDLAGRFGIANSGYLLDASSFLRTAIGRAPAPAADLAPHRRPADATRRYLASSEFCGACHDVRLFGSDVVGARDRGEHFKRLRNAYSEWRAWADVEERAGRRASTCQDCHMSLFPGVCAPGGDGGGACPRGTHFEPRPPGARGDGRASPNAEARRIASHYFTSVDVPLTPAYPDDFATDAALDADGAPLGLRARRDLLLRSAFTFDVESPARTGSRLDVPVVVKNTGAGHRVPAGFSQEREIWVELTVTDARGDVVYQVGKIDADDADLRDKVFLRVTTRDAPADANGRPLGVFGADVADGADVPAWSPNPALGGTSFRGKGLINLQNGFLRCVRCIGVIDATGKCQPLPGQGRTRADRFDDAAYDPDTGECRSNLSGGNELFETYFPLGALDADRGIAKAPDAIIDTRSAPPGVPIRYVYEIDVGRRPPPFKVTARLRFRAFPPFLVRAFAAYEAAKAAEGFRPSGPQVTLDMLRRIDVVDLAEAHVEGG